MTDSFADSAIDIGYAPEINTILSPLNTSHGERAGSETWDCAWSPDGALFAWSCGHRIVTIAPYYRIKNRLEIFDPRDDLPIRTDPFYVKLEDTSTLPDKLGRRDNRRKSCTWKSVSIDAGHLVWSMTFGCSTAKTKPRSTHLNVKALRSTHDLVLATGLSNGRIRVWDVSSGGLLWELMDHKDVIRHLKFCPSGNLHLASGSRDGSIKLWDLTDDGNMYKTFRTPKASYIYACTWSPDGNYLATVGNVRTAVIWELGSLSLYRKLEGHVHDVVDCDYSPDGALLATASYDTKVIVWDPHTGDKVRIFCHLYPPPHFLVAGGANGHYVRSVSFSHDGTHVSSVCDDGYVRFWHLYTEDVPVKVAQNVGTLCSAYSPDGYTLATGRRNGSVSFYRSPMAVDSLTNLCRIVIRRLVLSPREIDLLHIPIRHKEFLKYRLDI